MSGCSPSPVHRLGHLCRIEHFRFEPAPDPFEHRLTLVFPENSKDAIRLLQYLSEEFTHLSSRKWHPVKCLPRKSRRKAHKRYPSCRSGSSLGLLPRPLWEKLTPWRGLPLGVAAGSLLLLSRPARQMFGTAPSRFPERIPRRLASPDSRRGKASGCHVCSWSDSHFRIEPWLRIHFLVVAQPVDYQGLAHTDFAGLPLQP